MTRVASLRAILLATLLGLLACGDSTGPAPIDGTYALYRVEGRVGPPFVSSDLSCLPGDRIVVEILGDTITFSASGTARRASFRQARVWRQGVELPSGPDVLIRTAPYRREGSLVIITYPAFPPVLPADADTFSLATSSLERDSGLGAVCASGPTDVRIGKFEYARL